LFVISLSFSIGVIFVSKRARHFGLDHKLALDLCLAFMVGSLLGSRIFHVLYERPDLYWQEPVLVFEIWRGGFVYYGGFFGAGLLTGLLLRARKQSFWPWADLFAPVLSFGYAIGRVACFLQGCCYGRHCEMPWAVHFPQGADAPAGVPLHPTQLYATGFEFIVLAILLLAEKKLRARTGSLFLIWLPLHGLGRIFMEFYRDDFRGPDFLGLSISTFISLALIAAGLVRLWLKWRKPVATNTI
jgi:phosphatidylglycerol---prolipoprotein diacylglyceryl transferase